MDVIVAIFGLVLFSPMFLLIAIVIKLDSTTSILYTPQMLGQHGKPFSLLRFCTMSEHQLTRVGKFLRRYSLDHLPMLVNLLKGDLTLIGPRPMEAQLVDWADPIWQQYFKVRPGVLNYAVLKLGKLWTRARTSHPTLNQELELEYLQKRSIRFDLRLFLHALQALIKSGGNIKARGEPDADMNEKLEQHSP